MFITATNLSSSFSPSSPTYITSLRAVSPSLLFLVPLFAIVIFYLGLLHRNQDQPPQPQLFISIPSPAWSAHLKRVYWRRVHIIWSYFAISSLAILATLAGAFALSHGRAFTWTAAEAISTSFLRFELGVSVIYFLTVSIPCSLICPLKLCLYNMALAPILFCATLIAILTPFFPHTIPPFLSPLLNLLFTILVLPIITYTLLTFLHSAAPTPIVITPSPFSSAASSPSTPSFPPPSHEKQTPFSRSFMADFPLPPTSNPVQSPSLQDHLRTRNFYISLLCAQISALLSLAFGISVLILPGQGNTNTDIRMQMQASDAQVEALAFSIVQSVFTVLWTLCIMSAFLLHSFSQYSSAPSSTPFTPSPTRTRARSKPNTTLSSTNPHRTFLDLSFYPSRTARRTQPNSPPMVHPAPPTAPQNADDFLNLRDPFASPNIGAAIGTSADAAPAKEGAALGRTRMSTWGALPVPPVPPLPPSLSTPTSETPTALSSLSLKLNPCKPKSKSKPKPKSLKKPPHQHQQQHRKKGSSSSSSRALIPLTLPARPPLPYAANSRARSTSTLPSTYSYSAPAQEDVDFDPEEALLAQMLLKRLDLGSEAGGGGGGAGASGGAARAVGLELGLEVGTMEGGVSVPEKEPSAGTGEEAVGGSHSQSG